jgi:hypothetical protein
MAVVFFTGDGHGKDVGKVQRAFMKWIRANATADLIVYGGDVYGKGTPEEFQLMLGDVGGDVSKICHTPGNHCWRTMKMAPDGSRYPSGYEEFWKDHPPPGSAQPIDTSRKAGARYEHFIDMAGWRLIFLDTGPCEDHSAPWPMSDPTRLQWLEGALATPGRAKMVFAHHSRLSRGKHGDIEEVDALWQALFDDNGVPLAAVTFAGHDHNVSVYDARPRKNPDDGPVDFAKGIHVVVNGAGGRGHDTGWRGTRPDLFFDDDNYCLTRITLHDATRATLDFLGFGRHPEPQIANPSTLFTLNLPA